MKFITLKLAQIKPYTNNPRVNKGAVAGVKRSIQDHGYRIPMVVDKDNVLVTGHTRYLALTELVAEGMEDGFTVSLADDLTPEQVKSFRLADNRVSQNARWDDELLSQEMQQLRDMGIDLAMTGFAIEEIEVILDPIDLTGLEGSYDAEQPETKKSGIGNPIISYNLVFDTKDQQDTWFAWLKELKAKYPDAPSIAERLSQAIKGNTWSE